MPSRPASFATLGCRLNACETDRMRELASTADVSDTIIVNTCAVTAEAVRKSRQTIRRLRRDHPDQRIIATGCAAHIEADSFAAMRQLDMVIPNDQKLDPAVWADMAGSRHPDSRSPTTPRRSVAPTTRTRAYVQVQNGCDHRCTFCIIPFGRGPSRSMAASEVLETVSDRVERGYREVVLTGVDITSWGADLAGQPTLGRLITDILDQVPTLARLRISSIDPVEIDDEFLAIMGAERRLMPHLHLSLQSGDDMILKRMRRRHLRDDAIEICGRLRRLRPDIVFGADIIAGFPTETSSMFDNTMHLLDECGLTWVHVFPYSARPGTPAARMPQHPSRVIRERAYRLREAARRRAALFRSAEIGQYRQILVEAPRMGRTEHHAEVAFSTDQPVGSIVSARLSALDGDQLLADDVD